jgi:hypothetical protein
MLLTIFIFLVAFSLALIIGGFYIEAPVMQIAGTAVLFVTGLLLMFSNIEYVSAHNQVQTFSYESGNLSSVSINETAVLTLWDEDEIIGVETRHTVAFLLLVSAILIFVSVLSHLREGRSLDDE